MAYKKHKILLKNSKKSHAYLKSSLSVKILQLFTNIKEFFWTLMAYKHESGMKHAYLVKTCCVYNALDTIRYAIDINNGYR